MSLRFPNFQSFIAIYLRHGPAKNRVIYRKNCRDKEALGKRAPRAGAAVPGWALHEQVLRGLGGARVRRGLRATDPARGGLVGVRAVRL